MKDKQIKMLEVLYEARIADSEDYPFFHQGEIVSKTNLDEKDVFIGLGMLREEGLVRYKDNFSHLMNIEITAKGVHLIHPDKFIKYEDTIIVSIDRSSLSALIDLLSIPGNEKSEMKSIIATMKDEGIRNAFNYTIRQIVQKAPIALDFIRSIAINS